MTATDELVSNATRFAERFGDRRRVAKEPRMRLAVVTCMDSRIDLFDLLGLQVGEAHLLRNGGGVVTDDVIRSLTISQRALGTREIMLVHHTDCGMQTLSDDTFKRELEEETGVRPTWAVESFRDPASDVRQSMQRIRRSPFIPERDQLRGFVFDVDTGVLTEVS